MKTEHPQVRQVELIRLKEAEIEMLQEHLHNLHNTINVERTELYHLKQGLKRMMSQT